jgi:hypothetical protein
VLAGDGPAGNSEAVAAGQVGERTSEARRPGGGLPLNCQLLFVAPAAVSSEAAPVPAAGTGSWARASHWTAASGERSPSGETGRGSTPGIRGYRARGPDMLPLS